MDGLGLTHMDEVRYTTLFMRFMLHFLDLWCGSGSEVWRHVVCCIAYTALA